MTRLKPAFLLACCYALILALPSCSRFSGRLLIMEANFYISRGMYNEAAASYLRALDYEDAAAYAEYGLGSVYYSLDEGKAALERFADSRKILESQSLSLHRELRYRNHYNTGLALFGEGDFSAAAASFREALKTDPARIEAKRNLELSLLSIAGDKPGGGRAEDGRRENPARAVLFDYLRQKERNQWKSREWAPEEQDAGPDY